MGKNRHLLRSDTTRELLTGPLNQCCCLLLLCVCVFALVLVCMRFYFSFPLVCFFFLGYGDISCQTTLGKIALILFIFGGLVGNFCLLNLFLVLISTNMSKNAPAPVPRLLRLVYHFPADLLC